MRPAEIYFSIAAEDAFKAQQVVGGGARAGTSRKYGIRLVRYSVTDGGYRRTDEDLQE